MSWMALRPRKEMVMYVDKWARPAGTFDAFIEVGKT